MGLFRLHFPGFILLTFSCMQKTNTFDGCICLEQIAEGLRLPTVLVHANDGTNRLFVAEQYGVVHVYYPDGTKLPEPFMNISAMIGPLPVQLSESGICDIAFHPDFKSNKLFYMLFSIPDTTGGMDHFSVLGEFRTSSTDDNKADPEYRELLRIPQPVYAHNANELLFGVDGYLYIFVGDGGFQHDINFYAQNMKTFLGKVLRIDVDSRTDDLPYGIPADNPFKDSFYSYPEIYALGLRNPWRCGMDAGDRETGEGRGRIICGDVGQDYEEELDLIEKGANYGWNHYEGRSTHCNFCKLGPGQLVPPIFSYTAEQRLGRAIIGGEFYRGCLNPRLDGLYIYGDFYTGALYGLSENKATGSWVNQKIVTCDTSVCKNPQVANYFPHVASFGTDEDGELYLLAVESKSPYVAGGRVYRIVDPINPGDPVKCEGGTNQKTAETKQHTLWEVGKEKDESQHNQFMATEGAESLTTTLKTSKRPSPTTTLPTSVTATSTAAVAESSTSTTATSTKHSTETLMSTDQNSTITASTESAAVHKSDAPTTKSEGESNNFKTQGNKSVDSMVQNRASVGDDIASPSTTESNAGRDGSASENAALQKEVAGNLRRNLSTLLEKLMSRFGITGSTSQNTPSEAVVSPRTSKATLQGKVEEEEDLSSSEDSDENNDWSFFNKF